MTVFSMTYEQMKKLSNKNAKLDREIQQVKDSVKGINNPYYIDYILCKSVIEQNYANQLGAYFSQKTAIRANLSGIQRTQELEERRNKLTIRLKNVVLVKLSQLKRSRTNSNFKEVIA